MYCESVSTGKKIFSQFPSQNLLQSLKGFRRNKNYFFLVHRRSSEIKLNTHLRILHRENCVQHSREFWDCEGFLLLPAIIIITPGVVFLVIVSPSYIQTVLAALIQTLKSHDNIWCKVGDTYFLLYFCHMLLFKREKIVFYG